MIKVLVFFTCAVAAVNCQFGLLDQVGAGKPEYYLPSSVTNEGIQAFRQCMREHRIIAIWMILIQGEGTIKRMVHCVLDRTGYIHGDGRIRIDKAASLFPDKQAMKRVLTECEQNSYAYSPEDISYQTARCARRNAPYHIKIHY